MKYSTIVADPPWRIKAGRPIGRYVVENGKQLFGPSCQKARDLEYKTLSVQDICSLPVKNIAANNAHLYIWVVNSFVEQAYTVARYWGFTPSTLLVWAKNTMGGGLGGTYGISTEFVLFCRRGTLPALSRVAGTWWNWKRPYFNGSPKHSAKPEAFQDMVETVSPGPYIELFARRQRNGWDAVGEDINGKDVAEALQ